MIRKSSALVGQRTFNTPNTDLIWSVCPPALPVWPVTPSTPPSSRATPIYILYLLLRSQSEGRWVRLRRWRGGSWWNLASSWWRKDWRVCEREDRGPPKISSNSEPDCKQKVFFFSSSTTPPLSLFALRSLSCSLILPALTWLRPVS